MVHTKFTLMLNKKKPQSIKNCLDNFKKSWEDLNKISKVTENWEKLIGIELFMECKPLKIENKILTVAVNNPQWRQALIYNKHKLKERIENIGINLDEIKIIQNYELKTPHNNMSNAKIIWDQHPTRIDKDEMSICNFCNCPTPVKELSRWGKCTFCWRKNL